MLLETEAAQSSVGRPDPSTQDIKMTQEIVAVAKTLGVAVHDHIIIGRDGHASLRGMRLI
jgi:DNA repair protein RadC